MNKVIYNLTLDLTSPGVQHTIYAKSGDVHTRQIVIKLRMNGTAYKISDGADAYLYALADGIEIFDSCEITDNAIIVNLSTSILSSKDTVMELRLTDTSGAILTTPQIRVISEGEIYSEDAIIATDRFSALLSAISAAENSRIADISANGNVLTITYADGTSVMAELNVQSGEGNGESGATFTPSVSEGGVISWTNDKGLTNPSPVNIKGDPYVLTEGDKAEMVARVIESLGGNPVFGYVDEDNSIIVSGDLADGTYSVKYEMENGNKVDIGNLTLDSNVYYSVTNHLTNCTSSNTEDRAAAGSSYSATITANSGYELKSIVVTMGNTPVSVTNGRISIESVTDSITITAVADEARPVNVLPLSINADGTLFVGTNGEEGYKTGVRISGSSGNESTQSGCMASGFIAVKTGETAVIENITPNSNDNYNVMVLYDANFTKVINSTLGGGVITNPSPGVYEVRVHSFNNHEQVRYMRFSCATISKNTVVTIQS